MSISKLIHIFSHRGCGVTDIGPQDAPDAKGEGLRLLPPENSEEAIETAFKKGYSVEIDVTMTEDGTVIVTHTNDLSFHNMEAKRAKELREERLSKGLPVEENDWYVSRKTLEEMKQLRTGLGGRTAPFLTYERFLGLMDKYPNVKANVEIKGTIQSELMAEPKEPSLIDKLIEKTPDEMFHRIIWSSFAMSNLLEIRPGLKKKTGKPRVNAPQIQVAQLFAEPARLSAHGGKEDKVYPDTDDVYMQFTEDNVSKVFRREITAVHPCIESLMTEEGREAVCYCARNNITIRTWALNEKNPLKESEASAAARKRIENVMELKERYPDLHIDIITDYPEDVEKVIAAYAAPRPGAEGPMRSGPGFGLE